MQELADPTSVQNLVHRMADWVATAVDGPGDTSETAPPRPALIGIRNRGDVIAQRVGQRLGLADIGMLDITLYRDDLTEIATQPVVQTTEVDFAIDDRDVVLIDDVLMSGRSVRAALSVLMDLGRPRRVWLAVLVDRGPALRELPIAPDFVGLQRPVSQTVRVKIQPTDPADAILLEEPSP